LKSRRIYSSGKSRVLAVPQEWYDKLKKDPKDQTVDVLVRTYDDLLLVAPAEKPETDDAVHVEYKDYSTLECNIMSYYMLGKKRLSLVVSPKDFEIDEKLRNLSRKLVGMVPLRKSEKEITVTFDPPKSTITDLIGRMYALYIAMQKEAIRQFDIYPQLDETDDSPKRMQNFEDEVDRISYHTRRLLTNALYNPEILLDLDLKHPSDIIGYYRIENNLERLADLQKQVFDEILGLKKARAAFEIDIDMNPIRDMYNTAHQLVTKSVLDYASGESNAYVIRSKRDSSEKGQIKTARTQHDELTRWLMGEQIPAILNKDYTKIGDDKISAATSVIRSLLAMESKIYGMVGNASNISESWFFMLSRK
jgi:phosphate uptake regulator